MLGISRFCHTVSLISPLPNVICDGGERTHLLHRQPADRDRDADVVHAGLPLRMNSDVSGAVDGIARFALPGRAAKKRESKMLLRLGDELLHCPSDRRGT